MKSHISQFHLNPKGLANFATFQVCLFIIQLLLLKPTAFRDRLNYLVELTSVMNGGTTEHQLATDFHQASTLDSVEASPMCYLLQRIT